MRVKDCVQLKITYLGKCKGKTLKGHAYSKDDEELLLVWGDETMTCLQASGDEEYVQISERVYVDAGWFAIHDLISAGVSQDIIDQYTAEIVRAAALVAADAEKAEMEMYVKLKAKFESH